MYFGGNHYGTWAGSSITTAYAMDNNVCPDTMPHEPKYSHLGRMHAVLARYADAIVGSPAQLNNRIALPWFNNRASSRRCLTLRCRPSLLAAVAA
jgi:hypothetical protein